jgi:citrate synthase
MVVNVDESMSNSAVQWTTEQAARRLGVKPATVYAYVSRGILHSTRDPSGRGSLFQPGEVESLAQRRAPKRAAKNPGPLIGTALTQAADGRLRYRGRDVATLARTQTFESVATTGRGRCGPARKC